MEGVPGFKVWNGARRCTNTPEVSIMVVERFKESMWGGRWSWVVSGRSCLESRGWGQS